MNSIKLLSASFIKKDGQKFTIINPKVKVKKGLIFISGLFDEKEFKDIEDFKNTLNLNQILRRQLVSELDSITGIEEMRSTIEFNSVSLINIGYPTLKVSFQCYGAATKKLYTDEKKEIPDSLCSLLIEGIEMDHKSHTREEQTRFIFDAPEKRLLVSKRDFTEATLSFIYQNNSHDIKLAFIKGQGEDLVRMNVHPKTIFDLKTFEAIKFSFKSFLSFAQGNSVRFIEECFYRENSFYQKNSSLKKLKINNSRSYIPLVNVSFRSHNILQNYLDCFTNYLFIDEHLQISEIIFLINQAKKVDIESGFFILVVALERLASNLANSSLNPSPEEHHIEQTKFEELYKKVKIAFEETFEDVKTSNPKEYNDLYSKLCGINRKMRTDKKIDSLLRFAEVDDSKEAKKLFPILRNLAIHEGKIALQNDDALDNFKTLTLLVNDIVANLIQYKGYRYIDFNGEHTDYDEKKEYKINYHEIKTKKITVDINSIKSN